jgi:hypothetical protein
LKYFAFIFSWVIVFAVGRGMRSGDAALATFGIVLMLGILLNFLPDNKTSRLRKFGWGLFYGSITFGIVGLVLVIWLSYSLGN